MKIWLITLVSSLCFCSCYRMPEDGEVSTVPNTNNPTINRQGKIMMPGLDC